MSSARRALAVPFLLAAAAAAGAETYTTDHGNYARLVKGLEPGDTLVLLPDDYKAGLDIAGLQGRPDAWIVIKGPESGAPARFVGNSQRNTVEIGGSSYVAIENLTIDGGNIDGIFGISASGPPSHHIRVENCTVLGHGAHQATVAVSTKAPAWNWVFRRNRIVAAGTGMYLGDSDGGRPFIAGLIEHNLFLDAKGYNLQIKHQQPRDTRIPGIPTTPQKTIVRHNVFLKGDLVNEAGERPNLLLGGQPQTGPGSQDVFEVYGNLFYHNRGESLLQAEGRVSIHDNVFVDCDEDGVHLQDHHGGAVRRAFVYNNTFYGVNTAIRFVHPAREDHLVVGNLMFSNHAMVGEVKKESDNLHVPLAKAGDYVRKPSLLLGEMDFYPLPGRCKGGPIDLKPFAEEVDSGRDFNGTSKGDGAYRGAYAGEATNPGWALDAKVKGPLSAPAADDDREPPFGSVRITDGGTTADLVVDLEISADDAMSGMGPGAQMRFSNDGKAWSPPEPYASRRPGWDLADHGGTTEKGVKVVYARVRDSAGNWSAVLVAAVEYRPEGTSSGAPGN